MAKKVMIELGDGEFAFIVKRGNTSTDVSFDFKTGPGAGVGSTALCAALAIRSFIASGLCEELTQANYSKLNRMPDDDYENVDDYEEIKDEEKKHDEG